MLLVSDSSRWLLDGSPLGCTGVRACNALLTRRLKADVERHSLLAAGNSVVSEEKKGKTVKAALYGIQVFYSFFIM